jgi:hypothetical protein
MRQNIRRHSITNSRVEDTRTIRKKPPKHQKTHSSLLINFNPSSASSRHALKTVAAASGVAEL